MKGVAFLIQAHTEPSLLRRPVDRISNPEARLFVHIDKKSRLEDFCSAECSQETTFPATRVSVRWAGFSQVESTLLLIEAALNAEVEFTHLVLLLGQDYPPVSAFRTLDFFQSQPDREFAKYIAMHLSLEHYMRQILQKHFRDFLILLLFKVGMLIGRKLILVLASLRILDRWIFGFVPYSGINWWALTSSCASLVQEFVRKNPAFVAMNHETFSPGECLLHTIVGDTHDSAFATGLQHYVGVGTRRLASSHLVHPAQRKPFEVADWELMSQSKHLFIRNIPTQASLPLFDVIDRRCQVSP